MSSSSAVGGSGFADPMVDTVKNEAESTSAAMMDVKAPVYSDSKAADEVMKTEDPEDTPLPPSTSDPPAPGESASPPVPPAQISPESGAASSSSPLKEPPASESPEAAPTEGSKQDATSATKTEETAPPSIPAPPKPNRTLYVNNLDSKIKTDRLKRELRAIFENFGEVRDIIAMKSFWRRGQAWVIFATQEAADAALVQLQGFPYNNKEMRIQYARELSDIYAKEAGTFKERPPGPKKPRAIIEKEQRLQQQLQQFQQMMTSHMKQLQQQGQSLTPAQLLPLMGMVAPDQVAPRGQAPSASPASAPTPSMTPQQPLGTSAAFVPPMGSMFGRQDVPAFGVPAATQYMPMQQQPLGGMYMEHQPLPPLGAPRVSAYGGGFGGGAGGQGGGERPKGPAMSKDAMVAAAAAAAAQAVEAAKKRAAEGAPPSAVKPDPSPASGFNRFSPIPGAAPPAPPTGFFGGPAMGAPQPSGFSGGRPSGGAPASTSSSAAPNHTLFVENLPEDCDHAMLQAVFQTYPGCTEIRHVPSRRVAFVDYDTIPHANVALRYLNGFTIKENTFIRVSYARQ